MAEQRKGEQAPREAPGDQAVESGVERQGKPEGIDQREEEGYSQPESSAQKLPPES